MIKQERKDGDLLPLGTGLRRYVGYGSTLPRIHRIQSAPSPGRNGRKMKLTTLLQG